jgi:uncharacterized phage protein gp47/JayE
MTAVANAIETVRPIGSTWTVVPPTVTTANVSMTVVTASTASHATVQAQVSAAMTSFINALPVGAPLPWSRVAQVAYGASPSVVNVFAALINGGTSDIVPGTGGVVKAGSVTVS